VSGVRAAETVEKVTAFLTRDGAGGRQLLVFRHPAAGNGAASIQLPAGTVEPGEDPAAAVARELEEETGVAGARLHRLLASIAQPLDQDEVMLTETVAGEGRRGVVVRILARDGAQLRVELESQSFSVPVGSTTREIARHLYHLEVRAETADRWEYSCDCGVPVECYWAPLASVRLDPHQQPWLDRVRVDLGEPAQR
jgi:8-oxo-dGTP pyrophosphatase MutT (NUDIX family)